MFTRAERTQSRLRMTIDGPAGAGKTFTALRFAHALTAKFGGRIAYIDTERGSASKYAGDTIDGTPGFDFDVVNLNDFSPTRYKEMIDAAGRMGYTVLVVDSLSHAWEGTGGALEMKDQFTEASASKNAYNQGWRLVTPLHNAMIDSILQSPCHVITAMRSRMDYVQEFNDRGKLIAIRKVGMAPIQRPGMEYEFDLVCDMDYTHLMTVSKSRCREVDGEKIDKPGPGFMQAIIEWLTSGKVISTPEAPEPQPLILPYPEDPQQASQPHLSEATPVISLEDLVNTYGVEAIMGANGGAIPGTEEELAVIAEKLGGKS